MAARCEDLRDIFSQPIFRRPPTFQVLRVHLTDPRGDSLRLTDDGIVRAPNLATVFLEPSRSAMIAGRLGVGLEVRDWTHDRSVVINTSEGNIVRTFHE